MNRSPTPIGHPRHPVNTDKGEKNYVFTEAFGEWSNNVTKKMTSLFPKKAIIETDKLDPKTPLKKK